MRRIVLGILITLILVVGGAGTWGYYYVSNALEPINSESEKVVQVEIPIGSSVSEIAQKLEEKEIIHHAKIFQVYIKYKNETGFQAGNYEFSPSMTIDEIIAALKKGRVYEEPVLTLQFPEGIWMSDVVEIIAKKTSYSKKDIVKKMKDREYIESNYVNQYFFLTEDILHEEIRYPLLGYLFPATYEFTEENPSLEKILGKMLEKTGSVIKNNEIDIAKSELSIHEMVTLASLIEEEATQKADRRQISEVFYNRFDEGMLLQTDPTVKYAVKKKSGELTKGDLEADSPYNTYKYQGLPPGPIANPGKSSINAAVHPKETDALYFYARVNGEVLFSKTLPEHNAKVEKYNDEWDEYFEKQTE